MKEAAFPLMRDKPSEFEDLLTREGILLVRKEGKPFAVVIDVSEDSVNTIVQAVSQVRAQINAFRSSRVGLGSAHVGGDSVRD